MKKSILTIKLLAVIFLIVLSVSCEELLNEALDIPECERNQTATLKVRNESSHKQ